MEIVRLTPADPPEYFARVAELHMAEIHQGLLPLLGKEFLALLYFGLSGVNRSGVWIALHHGRILGFVAGCADTKRTMAAVLTSFGWRLLLAAGKSALAPAFLRRISAVLSYPFRQSPTNTLLRDVPKAELLAICVEPSSRGRSIGRQLVLALEKAFRHWGTIPNYHVKTNIEEGDSNAFYRMLGFKPAGTIPHHDLMLQIYVNSVDQYTIGITNNLPCERH